MYNFVLTIKTVLKVADFIVRTHLSEPSKTIDIYLDPMGFLYPSICSASQSAKNILKALHSNARHSNYEALKFYHTFSIGNPLMHSPLILCWHVFVMKPDVTLMKEAVIHFATTCN